MLSMWLCTETIASESWCCCGQACEESIINGNRTPRLTSQGLTNILWGYATLRYYPDRVLQAVTRELHHRMDTLGQQARLPRSLHLSIYPLLQQRSQRCFCSMQGSLAVSTPSAVMLSLLPPH